MLHDNEALKTHARELLVSLSDDREPDTQGDVDKIVAAFRDYLSASIPADIGEIAKELEEERCRLSGRSIDYGCADSGIAANLADRAASALLSLSARVGELENLVGEFLRANDEGPGLIDCIDNEGERYTSDGLDRTIRRARAVLSKGGNGNG